MIIDAAKGLVESADILDEVSDNCIVAEGRCIAADSETPGYADKATPCAVVPCCGTVFRGVSTRCGTSLSTFKSAVCTRKKGRPANRSAK